MRHDIPVYVAVGNNKILFPVLLGSTIITGSTATADFALTPGYYSYRVHIKNMKTDTANAHIRALASYDNGVSYDGSAVYDFGVQVHYIGVATITAVATTFWRLTGGLDISANNGCGNLDLFISHPGGNGKSFTARGFGAGFTESAEVVIMYQTGIALQPSNTQRVNYLRFQMSSGNMTDGSIAVYGISK